MTQDELIKYLCNIEPGNASNTMCITEEQYKSLEKELGMKFDTFEGPNGFIWIKVK